MKISCPKCRREIPTADVNVEKDIALCRNCNEAFSFADLLEQSGAHDIDLTRPPKGVWFERRTQGFELSATTRSFLAFFLIPFMCVWAGFSLGGIYGQQIYHHKFDLASSLFGIPFVLGTLFFGNVALMAACGKAVVTVDRDEGRVFLGVGPFGWTRRFKWSAVESIKEERSKYRPDYRYNTLIVLGGPKAVRFGVGITEERRQYMIAALKTLLRERHA